MRSFDASLRDRFRTVFPECSVPESEVGAPRVLCSVDPTAAPGLTTVHFDDPQELDAARFVTVLFADRHYHIEAQAGEWTLVGSDAPGAAAGIAMRGPSAVVAADTPWQPLIGNVALNRVLRLQRDVVFLHAGAVAIGGQGVLLTGPKHSGKTSMSAALAARGHSFLGDELSAIRLSDRTMVPFRRTLSFREGPMAASVRAALDRVQDPVREVYPDGTPRTRVSAAALFPGNEPAEAPLRAIFVLRSFVRQTRIERFTPTPADTGVLAPFVSSLWGLPPGLRAMKLAALLAGSACYHLDAGDPESAAAAIEEILEDGCP